MGSYYFKSGYRVLWNAFLLFYLCKKDSIRYFGIEGMNKWLALVKVCGVSILILILMSAVQ